MDEPREPHDLSFLLARSIALAAEPPRTRTGSSLARRNRAADQLGDAYARVTRARAVVDRHRHAPDATAEHELRRALDAFTELAATALGLEGP